MGASLLGWGQTGERSVMVIGDIAVMEAPIQVGQRLIVPWLPLALGDGVLRLGAYRGRANLALYMLPDGADPRAAVTLAGIGQHLAGYRERHTQPLAIAGGSVAQVRALGERLGLAYPLAADPHGEVVARLTPRDATGSRLPVAVLTDRYAEVRALLAGWAALAPAGQSELLTWFDYIDCLCAC